MEKEDSNKQEQKKEIVDDNQNQEKISPEEKERNKQKAAEKLKNIFEKLDEKAEEQQMEKLQRCIIF